MRASAVSEVILSENPDYVVGELVTGVLVDNALLSVMAQTLCAETPKMIYLHS
jgi:hypothetical protein